MYVRGAVGHRQGKKGSVIGERFEVHDDVGLGTFGRVLECWDMKRKRRVAVKVVRKVKEARVVLSFFFFLQSLGPCSFLEKHTRWNIIYTNFVCKS